MDFNVLLQKRIMQYFEKKLMPGIISKAAGLEKEYGSGEGEPVYNKDFFVGSFGFQTLFMMRYMLITFGVICLFLLVMTIAVNPSALEGVKIFGTFFILCLLLFGVCVLQGGYVVYSKDWIYVNQFRKQRSFSMAELEAVDVSKKLTLIFGADNAAGKKGDVPHKTGAAAYAGGKRRLAIPLEGQQYVQFMTFLEKNEPRLTEAIPKAVYDRAMRRHAGSWGNHM